MRLRKFGLTVVGRLINGPTTIGPDSWAPWAVCIRPRVRLFVMKSKNQSRPFILEALDP